MDVEALVLIKHVMLILLQNAQEIPPNCRSNLWEIKDPSVEL